MDLSADRPSPLERFLALHLPADRPSPLERFLALHLPADRPSPLERFLAMDLPADRPSRLERFLAMDLSADRPSPLERLLALDFITDLVAASVCVLQDVDTVPPPFAADSRVLPSHASDGRMSRDRDDLRELSQTLEFATQYSFRVGAERPLVEEHSWYHHVVGPDERIQVSLARTDEGYLVRFVHLAEFLIDIEKRLVVCTPSSQIPLATLRHVVIDRLLPMLVGQLGKTVVHASSVVTPNGAIVMVAETQHGKSTLSMSLCLDENCPSLADDCVVLELREDRWWARCLYPGARLWPETIAAHALDPSTVSSVAHYTEKKRVALPRSRNAAPLRTIYFLDWTDPTAPVEIRPQAPQAAGDILIQSLFSLYLQDPTVLATQLMQVRAIVNQVPMRRLLIPRDITRLPEVRRAVLEDG